MTRCPAALTVEAREHEFRELRSSLAAAAYSRRALPAPLPCQRIWSGGVCSRKDPHELSDAAVCATCCACSESAEAPPHTARSVGARPDAPRALLAPPAHEHPRMHLRLCSLTPPAHGPPVAPRALLTAWPRWLSACPDLAARPHCPDLALPGRRRTSPRACAPPSRWPHSSCSSRRMAPMHWPKLPRPPLQLSRTTARSHCMLNSDRRHCAWKFVW